MHLRRYPRIQPIRRRSAAAHMAARAASCAAADMRLVAVQLAPCAELAPKELERNNDDVDLLGAAVVAQANADVEAIPRRAEPQLELGPLCSGIRIAIRRDAHGAFYTSAAREPKLSPPFARRPMRL